MKKLLFLIFLIPILASAQYDFDTRYFKIDATSLPEIESLTTFSLIKTTKFSQALPTFNMSSENYRVPVNMFDAMTGNQSFVNSKIDLRIDPKEYGVYGNSSYEADGSTAVKNIAYKEAKGLYYVGTCPPTGICSRCAPFRVGRGY